MTMMKRESFPCGHLRAGEAESDNKPGSMQEIADQNARGRPADPDNGSAGRRTPDVLVERPDRLESLQIVGDTTIIGYLDAGAEALARKRRAAPRSVFYCFLPLLTARKARCSGRRTGRGKNA